MFETRNPIAKMPIHSVVNLLAQFGNLDAECEQFPKESWQLDVETLFTTKGYWPWVIEKATRKQLTDINLILN